jgi:hypothetical protein
MSTVRENALSPPEREALRKPIPVRENYSTVEEYRAARKDAGLDCACCGQQLGLDRVTRKGPTYCRQCENYLEAGEWWSNSLIRCPACKALHNAIDYISYIDKNRLLWSCTCGQMFDVKVRIEYEFISPELKEQNGH